MTNAERAPQKIRFVNRSLTMSSWYENFKSIITTNQFEGFKVDFWQRTPRVNLIKVIELAQEGAKPLGRAELARIRHDASPTFSLPAEVEPKKVKLVGRRSCPYLTVTLESEELQQERTDLLTALHPYGIEPDGNNFELLLNLGKVGVEDRYSRLAKRVVESMLPDTILLREGEIVSW